MNLPLRSALVVLTIISSCVAHSASECSKLFVRSVQSEQITQLRLWEELANQKRWQKPTQRISLAMVRPEQSKVVIRGDHVPEGLKQVFALNEAQVNWPQHLLNSSAVPFKAMPTEVLLNVFYSASRSMFFTMNGDLYSIKTPTDKPHPNSIPQPQKADLRNDVIVSMLRSEHILSVDERLGPSPYLKVLVEILSVAEVNSGNGFLVRDLRPLQDGNYYFPAFSIPYAGRKISSKSRKSFEDFWKKAYAEPLGRAKALYLLRYGLEMKTPNAQNWLIQFDKDMKPTGKIFLRDVPDSNFVDFVAELIGAKDQVDADREAEYTILTELFPDGRHSFWQMDEGRVRGPTISIWSIAHDRAYISTIKSELGIDREFESIEKLSDFLKSPEGQEALKRYRH